MQDLTLNLLIVIPGLKCRFQSKRSRALLLLNFLAFCFVHPAQAV
jgi:hypothetical protein